MLTIKKLIKVIFINFSVLLVLLALVEIVLRLLGYGYSNSPADPDATLHHVHPVDYLYKTYTPSGEFGDFMTYYDSLGRRSQLPGVRQENGYKSKKIAFFGDSFVEALQVPYDSSFIGLLAQKFSDISFLNYGVTGYSPVLNYLQCKKMLYQHQVTPDAVVMVLYSNDVRDDSTYIRQGVYSPQNHELIGIKGGSKNWFNAFFRKLYLARMIRKSMIKWNFQRKNKEQQVVQGVMVHGLLEESPEINSTLTAKYILKMDSLLKSHNIPFYITAIPSRYKNFTGDTSFLSFSERVHDWASSSGISIIPLDSAFAANSARGVRLFYNIDMHCNGNGHKVQASVLENMIPLILNRRHQGLQAK